jgi:hypothetical protein
MGVMVTLGVGVGMERRDGEGVEVFEGGGGGSACCQSRVVQEMKRETFHARHVRCAILILVLYQVPRQTCARRRSRPALSLAVDASDQAPSEMRIALYLCNLGAIALVALM